MSTGMYSLRPLYQIPRGCSLFSLPNGVWLGCACRTSWQELATPLLQILPEAVHTCTLSSADNSYCRIYDAKTRQVYIRMGTCEHVSEGGWRVKCQPRDRGVNSVGLINTKTRTSKPFSPPLETKSGKTWAPDVRETFTVTVPGNKTLQGEADTCPGRC
eukprot:1186699-Prorocentrum_minimum.AAC.3